MKTGSRILPHDIVMAELDEKVFFIDNLKSIAFHKFIYTLYRIKIAEQYETADIKGLVEAIKV